MGRWMGTPVVLLLALVGAGCTSDPPAAAPPPRLRLDASVTQNRFDEGTADLLAGVTNKSERDIRVTRATIAWDALAFPSVRLPGEAIHPGQTAAFRIRFGDPRCGRPSRTRPVLVAVIDGRTHRLPLRVEDPGLLVRLQVKACVQQRLDQAASVELRIASRTVRVAGEEYLPADLVLQRRSGSVAPVRVVDLDGSVLIELLPRHGRRSLPAVLGPRRTTLDVPVLFGSAHRCDGHARGQSSQTFLFSTFVRVGDRAVQRVVLPLTSAEQNRVIGVVDRDCD
jgi:hypothetical protein